AVAKAAGGKLVRCEFDVRRTDGALRTLDFSLKPVTDETGKVVLLIPEGRDVTERIRQAGERATMLTHQLLAFSRRPPLEPKVLDLKALLGGLANKLGPLIGVDIELAVLFEPDLGLVKADPGQVE